MNEKRVLQAPLGIVPSFLDVLAENPRGWGRALPPLPQAPLSWAQQPEKYQGEIRNLPARPHDFMAPVAEMVSPTLGGYGMGQLGGAAYLHGRKGEWGEAALNAAPLLAMGIGPGVKPPKGIRAFHGSPHDFDKFDASKIGTGEGAQAYGHGLYFAETEAVAKRYRDQARTPEQKAAADKVVADYKKAISEAIRNDQPIPSLPEFPADAVGKMYEVRLNAEPEQFLDWDKLLSQQSEAIRRAVKEHDAKSLASFTGEEIPGWGVGKPSLLSEGDPTGAQLYARAHGLSDKDAFTSRESGIQGSKTLQEALGLPGIRYLDHGSRTKGEGTANYVVFPGNEHIISIVKKYGIAGAAAMLGMSQADLADAMEQK